MASAPPISSHFSFRLNGTDCKVGEEQAHTTLLDFLRSRGLTGAKEGCAEGECGSCTVVLVRPDGENSFYQPVNSCLVFLPMAAGHEIYTVEALAREGSLHPAQSAMAQAGGSQCGYCTPGFVMSLFAEQHRPGRTGPCRVQAMGGNLCRCTGYRPIQDAAQSLGPAAAGWFRDRQSRPAPLPKALEQPGFSRPEKLADCFSMLELDPKAKLVAGATDLAVDSNLRGERFHHLVSVELLPELRVFEESDSWIELGAALSLSEIEAQWRTAPPFLAEWLELFASPLIRNRATLGGNLATASPIGDSAPLLLALDAEVRIVSHAGSRLLPLAAFFTGRRRTVLMRGELLASIRIPKPLPSLVRFYKIAKRRADDISSVAAAFALRLDPAGRVEMVRLAYGGVAPTPVRARAAEEALLGSHWGQAAIRRAQAALARELAPIGDHRASAAYRLAMAQSLMAKFDSECVGALA